MLEKVIRDSDVKIMRILADKIETLLVYLSLFSLFFLFSDWKTLDLKKKDLEKQLIKKKSPSRQKFKYECKNFVSVFVSSDWYEYM
jgi:hypothetical protein